MSKLMSVIHMVILWDWLVDHPNKDKESHPFLPVFLWCASCPLCQYIKEVRPLDVCEDCPMYKRWPTPGGLWFNCGVGAYWEWERSKKNDHYYDASFFALIIAEEAELLLKGLSGGTR